MALVLDSFMGDFFGSLSVFSLDRENFEYSSVSNLFILFLEEEGLLLSEDRPLL